MLLSIMIPAVFDRGYSRIYEQLTDQIAKLTENGKQHNPVEILALFDNRQRSTGRKRQALLEIAQGHFVTCLDDDDGVADSYVYDVLHAIGDSNPEPDVIVFNSQSSLNGEEPFVVRTGVEFENEQCFKQDGKWADIRRKPWHWCVWNRKLAMKSSFPDGYIDDDWYWVRQMLPLVKNQVRIDKVLHFYQYNSKTSLSQQGKSTT